MKFEAVTNYYNRQTRKNVRHVHGIVEADSADQAAEVARSLYGAAGCKLDGVAANDFNAKRSIKVAPVGEAQSTGWSAFGL